MKVFDRDKVIQDMIEERSASATSRDISFIIQAKDYS
eukprot:CAMPEP_0185598582 /NCGR_PEP_ID=MMETSP0434-20130131/82095_1 /TAXON_ID=626734 ORGANISM="Favella taraikaensis, Strain Fe Narragansett Bay" /NCGR_SAMPLE_ID=MMETSP0434 /ASSEMBLY_ACC=CAM_ASM_000379 /LENGTH=36 /DNA_ID= /DNA_START= /DNA_END= /DNA_ORIENTATION=